jgi:predicted transcriptional regulator of viral defense system
MEGLSKKEIEIISWLEFNKRYFFTSSDVDRFVKNKTQRYNVVKHLIKKGRIVKLNKSKYYLIPIIAKNGGWSEHPFIIADEICNGKNYFIGGWSAANYWRLTDQIPFITQVYTTRRQGKIKAVNVKITFHRTSKKRLENAVTESIQGHSFRVLSEEESQKWMMKRK